MKKSYHSSEVPTRLATMTRRTDEAWAVPGWDDIRAPRDRFRSVLFQHRPEHVPAQQEATHGVAARSRYAAASDRLPAREPRQTARRRTAPPLLEELIDAPRPKRSFQDESARLLRAPAGAAEAVVGDRGARARRTLGAD